MPKRTYLPGLLAGAALVLSACTGGSGGGSSGGGTSSPAQGDQLVIQPIQVCNNSGRQCAQIGFFETVTQKIWDQAGLQVTFLPTNQLNDSTYLSVAPGSSSSSEFYEMSFSGEAEDFGRHPSSTRNSGPINLWFVDTIEVGSGLVQFGNAWVGSNGVLISDDIFDFNNGAGRIDVIAHEVGHNLGLRHSTLGAGASNNLMTSGTRRAIPDSIDDVYPDGARLDRLNDQQIEVARSSGFLMSASGLASLTAATPDVVVSATASGQDAVLVSEADAVPVSREGSLVAASLRTGAVAKTMVDATGHAVSVPEPGLSGWVWLGLASLGGRFWQKRRSQLGRKHSRWC